MSKLSDPRIKQLGEQAMNVVLPELVKRFNADETLVIAHIQTAGLAVSAALVTVINNFPTLRDVVES